MRSMSATSSPAVRLRRALDAGSLTLAEAAARECRGVELEDALGICLLLGASRDARFERAAVRWAGRLCTAHPEVGFADARFLLALGHLAVHQAGPLPKAPECLVSSPFGSGFDSCFQIGELLEGG